MTTFLQDFERYSDLTRWDALDRSTNEEVNEMKALEMKLKQALRKMDKQTKIQNSICEECGNKWPMHRESCSVVMYHPAR